MLRILHIAPFNTAGVPMAFVKAERSLGFESRLVTFGRNAFGFEEDICLDLPFMDGRTFRHIRNRISGASHRAEHFSVQVEQKDLPLVWKPRGLLEAFLIGLRDRIWQGRIQDCMNQLDFFNFDIYQFDGGLDFSRNGVNVKALHKQGKKIVCCYLGSDLRTRGVIPEIDNLSDINFTVEYDHLALHPDIHYVFFPYDPWRFKPETEENVPLRLFHSATNRGYKGSDQIIEVGRALESALGVDFIFMENTSHEELLAVKKRCDIMIDQITNLGGVGYGVSSLEGLSMGMAVCTRLTPEYEAFIPDHPFVRVTPETLYDTLVELITDTEKRRWHRQHGRNWVEQYHDAKQVVEGMHTRYQERGWFTDINKNKM